MGMRREYSYLYFNLWSRAACLTMFSGSKCALYIFMDIYEWLGRVLRLMI